MSSTFNFNCPVPLAGDPTIHECGIIKSISGTTTGLTSNVTTYNLRYNLLENLKPVYVTIKPTVSKLIKFVFNNFTLNGSNIDVYIKQGVGIDIKTVLQFNIPSNSSSSINKYVNFLLDSESKNDLFITIDIVINGGSGTRSFNCQALCNSLPTTSHEFCVGWLSDSTFCNDCPITVTYFAEETLDNITAITNKKWYTDDTLTTEVTNGIKLISKVNFQGSTSRIIYNYNTTTHRLEYYNSCVASSFSCSQNFISLTHLKENYTNSSPHFPSANINKFPKLKWSTKVVHLRFPEKK